MVRRMRPSLSSTPRPQSSTPQLLLMVSSPVVPASYRAWISAAGIPHSPNPPTASEAPSGMSATAAAGLAATLLIIAASLVSACLLAGSKPQVPGDQHQLDLRCPLADLEHLRIPVVAGHPELVDVPEAAEDLRGIPGVVHGRLPCHHLGNGGLGFEGPAGQQPGRGVVVGQPGGVRAGLHPGDLELDPL